jgi:hypothetical protein
MMDAVRIEAAATEIAKNFADGISWDDVYSVIPKAMVVAEGVEGLTGPEKKALALTLLKSLLDKLDLPGPDVVVKPLMLTVAPFVIDLVISASRGDFGVNKPKP